jgi:hypothetical protein
MPCVLDSPLVALKSMRYCVLAPAAGDGESWSTVTFVTELALAGDAPTSSTRTAAARTAATAS